MSLLLTDEDREHFKRQCLADTGFICRNLLGWNYDEGPNGTHINVGTGGIIARGNTQKIVKLIDSPRTRYKFVVGPRGCRKSTLAQGLIVRSILLNSDIRVLYITSKQDLVEQKSEAIRNALELPSVVKWFGDQKGDSQTWEKTEFTVGTRKQKNLQSPTFTSMSMESLTAGMRADLVVCDDLINEDWVTNDMMMEKAQRKWALIQPFVAGGAQVLCLATPWGDGDLTNEMANMAIFQKPYGEVFWIGAGAHIVKDDKTGTIGLEEDEGGTTFEHMPIEFLREKFAAMASTGRIYEFSCQYLCVVPAGGGSMFSRWMFQPIGWGPDMAALSGFLVTDTAISKQDDGCYSVVGYVALDAMDNIYVLDMRLGHWDPNTFVTQFFDVLDTWSQKINHIGEAWEEASLANTYEFIVRERAKARKVRLNSIRMKRLSVDSKDGRIQRLHGPMYDRKLFVVDTVPKFFDDLDGKRLLWDPEGFKDAQSGAKLPDGELVTEFVRFKAPGVKKDIADSIAMVLEYDKAGGRMKRHCQFRPSRKPAPTSLTEDRTSAYRAAHYSSDAGGDWWEKTLRDF